MCGAILPGVIEASAALVHPPSPANPPPTKTYHPREDRADALPSVAPAPAYRPSPDYVPSAAGGGATVVAGALSSGPPRAAVNGHSPHQLLGRIKLVVEQGKILGEQFLLSDAEAIVGRYDAGSGRCPDIDLTAQDPAYVHRAHVRLAFNRDGTELTMHDMGGRNGSYVNNRLLEKNGSTRVQPGDKLRVGRVVMRVQHATEVDLKGSA